MPSRYPSALVFAALPLLFATACQEQPSNAAAQSPPSTPVQVARVEPVPATCETACKSFQIPGVNSVQKFPPRIMRSSSN